MKMFFLNTNNSITMTIPFHYHLRNLDNTARIKTGMERRLSAGRWAFAAPLGYRLENGVPVTDPVRAPLIREMFERWATGENTTKQLAAEMTARGLVSRSGGQLAPSHLARLLKNPFYAGAMVVGGRRYAGNHPAIVSPELFERVQTVFEQKVSGRSARKHLDLLLVGKVICPRCGKVLVGEHHQKPSGKTFNYYRCRAPECRFVIRAKSTDDAVCAKILERLAANPIAADADRLSSIVQGNDLIAKRELVQSLVARVIVGDGDDPVLRVFFVSSNE